MRDEDAIELPEDDFRRLRRYLAPWVFLLPEGGEGKTWPPPSDLVPREDWDGIMDLPTDVALKSSSYEGSIIQRLHQLQSDWIFSWPEPGEAPFMDEVVLLAGEEFDALVFNALHGWYRQAIGCLRNALETMATATAFAVNDQARAFESWRSGEKEYGFGTVRALIRDSKSGRAIEEESAPASIFGDSEGAWLKRRYARLCAYAHSRGGYNNADLWESNGPIFVPRALSIVEAEFRETLAISYLLLRLSWPSYRSGRGQPNLLDGPQGEWAEFSALLHARLLA